MTIHDARLGRAAALDFDHREFRNVLGSFGTGVTVVATGSDDPVGMTVNSFASVSLDPPLVLFCARKGSQFTRRLDRTSTFSINVLTGDQEHAARHFAWSGRGSGEESFAPVRWARGVSIDAPVVLDSSASLECRTWDVHDGGDHTIHIGEVLSVHRRPATHSLVFLDGRYHRIARATEPAAPASACGTRQQHPLSFPHPPRSTR